MAHLGLCNPYPYPYPVAERRRPDIVERQDRGKRSLYFLVGRHLGIAVRLDRQRSTRGCRYLYPPLLREQEVAAEGREMRNLVSEADPQVSVAKHGRSSVVADHERRGLVSKPALFRRAAQHP